MFETRHQPLIPLHRFFRRLAVSLACAGLLVFFALTAGTAGYHYFAELPIIDAFLNASMILTGMGPVDPLKTSGAKIFASLYALFSGVIFISTMGVLLAPLFHRMMHRFHLQEEEDEESE